MSIQKIDNDLLQKEGRFNSCLEDVPEKSASEMKEFLDYIPKNVIIPKVNEIIENVYTKEQSDQNIETKADFEQVYTKKQTEDMLSNLLTGEKTGNPLVISDLSPYSHKLDIYLTSRNLLPYPYYDTECTVNGITYTPYSDGSIHINGTATASSNFVLFYDYVNCMPYGIYPGKEYTLSLQCDTPVKGCNLLVNYYNEPPKGANYLGWLNSDAGNSSKTAVFPADGIGVRAYINIAAGVTVNDIVVTPQLERGTEKTDYYPYENVLSEQYVELMKGEQLQELYTDSEGKVCGIDSCKEGMIFNGPLTTVISCTYKRDIDKAFAELEAKIKGGK